MRYGSVFFLAFLAPLSAQQSPVWSKALQDLQRRLLNAKQYSWTGSVSMAVRSVQGPLLPVGELKAEVARAEGGKQLLHIKSQGARATEYLIVSNGAKTWWYLPDRKEYSEDTSASTETDASEEQENLASDNFAHSLITTVGRLIATAESIRLADSEVVKTGKAKEDWPVIDIVGKLDAKGNRAVARIVMAPDRPVLHRFTLAEIPGGDVKNMSFRIQVEFREFQVGEPVSENLFTFDPPKRAKLVEQVIIPGQAGSVLLNHTSPEIETRTLSGEKFKLSSLQGKVVLLNFWASWCPPCRAELPTIAKLHEELKDKGLVVYGVNDEEARTARKYLEGAHLNLPTLDDSSHRAHSAYRVTSIPMVFVIGRDGKVSQWLRGGHSEKSLREAIRQAGITTE